MKKYRDYPVRLSEVCHIQTGYIDHKVTVPKSKVEKCSIKKRNIFFTPSSEVQSDIGHSAVAMKNVNQGVYSYHIVRLRPKIEIDRLYSASAFKSHGFYKQASKYADGSGQRYVVSQNNFQKIEVFLPPLKEQNVPLKFLTWLNKKSPCLTSWPTNTASKSVC